jgi:hypothetical protein
VKFGLSPFGIWRPGYPPQIRGFDAYAVLYADSKKWLQNGWVDYFTPQLYWAIEPKEQSFSALLDWWNQQNAKQRHIWPGMNTTRVRDRWRPDEIVNQIRLAARQPVSAGHVHWNMKSLLRSRELTTMLSRGLYAEPALVPGCPWLARAPVSKPACLLSGFKTGNLRLSAGPPPGAVVRQWVLQTETAGKWQTEILPGGSLRRIFGATHPSVIAITPVDRYGNAGPAVVWQKQQSGVTSLHSTFAPVSGAVPARGRGPGPPPPRSPRGVQTASPRR